MYAGRRVPVRAAVPGGSGGPSGSTVLQLLLMVGFAAFVFMAGVIVGVQFFDVHRAGTADDAKPWAGLTKGNLRPPVERPAGGAAKAAAAPGGGHGKLRRAKEEPAPAAAAAGGADASPPEVFGSFAGAHGVELGGSADATEVSFGAWVYLDSNDPDGRAIKTIASNRAGGCAVDAAHRGYSFFVNNWETGDRALVLEWRNSGGEGGGCGRLSSEPGTIPLDTWTHVAFALQKPGTDASTGQETPGQAMLFLNGKLLRTGASARAPADVMRGADASNLRLGVTADGKYPWRGRIAHAFVAAGVVTPRQLAAAVALTDLGGWASMAAAGAQRLLASVVLSSEDLGGTAPGSATGGEAVPLPPSVPAPGGSGVWVTELTGKMPAVGRGGAAAGGVGALAAAAPKPAAAAKPAAPAAGGGVRKPAAAAPKVAAAAAGAGGGAPPKGAKYAADSGIDKIPAAIRREGVPGTAPAGSFDFSSGGNQWVPRMIRVPSEHASGSTSDPAALAAGTFSDDVTAEELAASDALGRERALKVKAAMQHVWANYRAHAWGRDELKPRSGTGHDNWAGVGMTLVDSLDTLWVMGMKEEFAQAREWVATALDFNKPASISVFETTIRALGGLLSAYDLSGDDVFLAKARDLGDRLLPAFDTPTGIPRASVVLATGSAGNPGWTGGASILAELGTLQVEFRYLSHATGEPKYGRKAEAVIERMDGVHPANGLFPIYFSPDSGQPTTSHVTFGALGDSFYEYLIKVWVQGGRREGMYRRLYDDAMEGMSKLLLKRSSPSNLAYVADWNGASTEDKMDHLVCFVPGMLALGAYTAAGTPGEANAVRDLTNAKALAYTCYQMYERMATGIAPEYVTFPGGRDLEAAGGAPFYILRPEAAEALYVLHQLTGNPIYREWGWKMFAAIDRYCKTEFGYGAHPDVRDTSRVPDDRMESFFLAETLKYLYMLQSPDHIVSLDKYTFNTEAHPLSVFAQ